MMSLIFVLRLVLEIVVIVIFILFNDVLFIIL